METYVTRYLDNTKNIVPSGERFEVMLKGDVEKLVSQVKQQLKNGNVDKAMNMLELFDGGE